MRTSVPVRLRSLFASQPVAARHLPRREHSPVVLGSLMLVALLALSATARAQDLTSVYDTTLPTPRKWIVGMFEKKSDLSTTPPSPPVLCVVTTHTFYTSPLYVPGGELTFQQTTNVDFPILGMTLDTRSLAVPSPVNPNVMHVSGVQGFMPSLYNYRFSPQGFSASAFTELAAPPRGMAVDGSGAVYVSDFSAQAIRKYADTSVGTVLLTFGTSGEGTLTSPTALALGPDGLLYVLDTGSNRIVRFDGNGTYQGQIALVGTTDPGALAVDASGRVYTANGQGGGTIYDSSTGEAVGTLTPASSSPDPSDGVFEGPHVAISGAYLYLHDDATGLHVYELPTTTDADGDGVADASDQCAGTAAGAVVDAMGCSIAQLAPCEGPLAGGSWGTHGQYVRSVGHVAESFLAAGLITQAEKDAVVAEAARSDCGR